MCVLLAVLQARRRQRRRKPGASKRINGVIHEEGRGRGEEDEGGSASEEVGTACMTADSLLRGCSRRPLCQPSSCALSSPFFLDPRSLGYWLPEQDQGGEEQRGHTAFAAAANMPFMSSGSSRVQVGLGSRVKGCCCTGSFYEGFQRTLAVNMASL